MNENDGSIDNNRSPPQFQANKAEITEFLAMLPHPIQLVSIFPDGPIKAKYFDRDLVAAALWAEEENHRGWNIYFSVNEVDPGRDKKATKSNIVRGHLLHVDVDPPFDRDAVLQKARAMAHEPSFIIDSGGGLQLFWRLDAPTTDLEKVEELNQRLAAMFGGDHCHNCDRLMRLPGTWNVPTKTKLAKGRVPVMASLMGAGDDR